MNYIQKLYLCRECGHVQESNNGVSCGDNDWLDNCESCEGVETLDYYVKSFNPKKMHKLKTWTDRLAFYRVNRKYGAQK